MAHWLPVVRTQHGGIDLVAVARVDEAAAGEGGAVLKIQRRERSAVVGEFGGGVAGAGADGEEGGACG